ncbi:uncharacterized protein BO80DRAFT_55542 [Aspergillus ibericus CBS 121593]|uniref:Uncharacterized protein n=1 Tax=Aspergillus ibericus CBS 121593 TaxID=1448316 RepID=A0A395H1E9_9EURO|nr:hypothetical protein BO80DRAFT_55542 [Aspergillus ibericus CBS 121593]RAL01711.1 hypothetical protein BO80DRAFT_55542 [Aspergillus ibericus CBS 121593]
MRATPAVKFPWSKLHLPLPRTPRQSKQLLNAITSSFRRQLDREYPTNKPSLSNHSHAPEEPSPAKSNSSAHATDRLMHNILNNPLFRVKPSESAISSNTSGMRDAKQRRMLTEPMVVFDELAAAGHVESKDLFLCLQYQLMLARASGDVVKAMKDSKAGTKVVNWWRASNWDDRVKIFQHQSPRQVRQKSTGLLRTSTTLLKFMVAEGMQDTVLLWWMKLAAPDPRDFSSYIDRDTTNLWARCLLTDLVAAEIQYGGGLGSAMRYYVQVNDLYFSKYPDGKHDKNSLFRNAGYYLFINLSLGTPDSGGKIPTSLFSEYSRAFSRAYNSELITASLALHHPTQPDPRPFLQFVRDYDMAALQALSKIKRRVFAHSCSVAIRILTDRGKHRDAAWLSGVLRLSDETKVEHDAPASEHEKSSLSGLLQIELALT